jgi:hypothetical protein
MIKIYHEEELPYMYIKENLHIYLNEFHGNLFDEQNHGDINCLWLITGYRKLDLVTADASFILKKEKIHMTNCKQLSRNRYWSCKG